MLDYLSDQLKASRAKAAGPLWTGIKGTFLKGAKERQRKLFRDGRDVSPVSSHQVHIRLDFILCSFQIIPSRPIHAVERDALLE